MQTEPKVRQARSELPALSEHLEYAGHAFAEARERGARIVRLSVAAPLAPLLAQPAGSMLWCQNDGTQWIGSGHTAEVVGSGPGRFQEIKAGAAEIWAQLYDAPHGSAKPELPRLFGGLSFASSAQSGEWTDFGQGRFWLPRTLYVKYGHSAALSLCADIGESPEAIATELFEEQRRLSLASESAPRQAQIEQAEHLDPAEWKKRIDAIRVAISSGSIQKVVAARKSRLRFRDGIELRPALERLTERYPDCYRFAFQIGKTTFLGASPETLVNKSGLRVRTQALAGSIAADLPNAGEKLLASKKDRFEQDLVVEAIVAALTPLCSEIQRSETPQPRTLRHLTHLCTPIQGHLHTEEHILDLVEVLHPTPAVGGAPVGEAMKWIAEAEDDRGWYAAPVGWFDSAGDGNFAVAIRSALFTGSDALVYAGAGIVADSDPQLEYQETGLKQRAILDALGILG